MLLKKNKIYDEMVKRNGVEDPLRKTLLIIDEAHKLYSPTVAASEKPDTFILEKMIQKSYEKSGADSVRVLLMTATPFTEDGMEMIKLLNLLKEDKKFETDFASFSKTYLDSNGYFTKTGLKDFQDSVSGYISYLNRSQDARNFAHPVIKNVYAKMSLEKMEDETKDENLKISKETKEAIKAFKNELKDIVKQEKGNGVNEKGLKACIKLATANFKANAKKITGIRKEGEKKCKKEPKDQRDNCNNKVIEEYNELLKNLNIDNENELKQCQDKNKLASSNSKNKKMKERKNEINKEIEKYNKQTEFIKENKLKTKGLKENIKELNKNRKALVFKIRSLRGEIDIKKAKYKRALAEVKDIIDKSKHANEIKFIKSEAAPLFLQIKELKELRARASKLNTQAQVFKVANGLKKMKKISQEYALNKYCD